MCHVYLYMMYLRLGTKWEYDFIVIDLPSKNILQVNKFNIVHWALIAHCYAQYTIFQTTIHIWVRCLLVNDKWIKWKVIAFRNV